MTAPPATAHAAGGPKPTNYRSQLLGLSPATPGVTLTLLDLGRKVRLVNRTAVDVVVLGYDNEPYLRVGPTGTFENERSPSLYKNRTSPTGGSVPVPATADAAAAPDWHRVNGGQTVTWADHRTTVTGPPPAAPGGADVTRVVVPQWSLPMRHGDAALVAVGTVTWVPGASAVPWLIAAAVLAIAVVGLSWLSAWGQLLAAVTAVLVAIDVVHAVGLAMYSARDGVDVVVRLIGGSYLSIGGWAAGIAAIGGLQRGREGGLFAACFTGAVVAILSGFTDLTVLTHSQVPISVPIGYARAAIAASLGMGLGLVAGAGRHMARMAPARRAGDPA
jgi:hypothetical protein